MSFFYIFVYTTLVVLYIMFNDNIIYEYPKAERLIIIGDVHGDLKRFKKILINANIINNNMEWIAEPNTVVIQLGDQIDSINRDYRIEEWEKIKDIEMIYFTHYLDMMARPKGCKVISLIGNHEMMNALGIFDYVSKFSNFDSRPSFFKPKGTLSQILSNRPIIVKIGDLLFCHAGLTKSHLDILESQGKDVSYLNDLWKTFILTGQIHINDKDIFNKILIENDGILWSRNLDNEDIIKELLNKLECSYMFIGHTPVNEITMVKNRIWYVDTGLSRAFGNISYQYLEIKNFNIMINTITDNEDIDEIKDMYPLVPLSSGRT